MSEVAGFLNSPLYTGQSPLNILNRDDFPQPLGPVMSRCIPGVTVRVRLGQTTSQLGVTIGTSLRTIVPSVVSQTVP